MGWRQPARVAEHSGQPAEGGHSGIRGPCGPTVVPFRTRFIRNCGGVASSPSSNLSGLPPPARVASTHRFGGANAGPALDGRPAPVAETTSYHRDYERWRPEINGVPESAIFSNSIKLSDEPPIGHPFRPAGPTAFVCSPAFRRRRKIWKMGIVVRCRCSVVRCRWRSAHRHPPPLSLPAESRKNEPGYSHACSSDSCPLWMPPYSIVSRTFFGSEASTSAWEWRINSPTSESGRLASSTRVFQWRLFMW